MKIRVTWITYSPIPEVKIKLLINKTVDNNERSLTKLFNDNLRRIYEISPDAHKNPDLIQLQAEDGRRIDF